MKKLAHLGTVVFATLFLGLAFAQNNPEQTALSNEEAIQFIQGKNHSAKRLAGGSPSLQFKDNGTLYGNNEGSSDSGKWRIEDGKLCMNWRKWEYEGCGKLVKIGEEIHHLYQNGTTTHLVFKK